MKFGGTMICVKDVNKARNFYENLFGLKVEFDFKETIVFDCGLSIMEKSWNLTGIPENEIKYKANNFGLHFEEENFDNFILKLKENKNIEYVHKAKEYDWGERFIRIRDLDEHIIEIVETMDSVIKRFLKNGLSVEETAKRVNIPVEQVKNIYEDL